MRKFYILLKKEVKELLTLQVILPLIITALLFMFIGKVVGNEQTKNKQPQDIYLVDMDNSGASALVAGTLSQSNLKVEKTQEEVDTLLHQASSGNKLALIVIPKGFESSVKEGVAEKIKVYTIIRSFSMTSGQSYATLMAAVAAANEAISNVALQQKIPNADPVQLKNLIKPDEFIIVGDRQANVSPNLIMGFVTQQTTFIPIILFFVIVFSSQMIATAIATEKENKTLETLLTAPVSRKAIVISKMMGAGIVALLASGIYMVGFKSYVGGLSGQTQTATADISNIIKDLGLSITPQGYILLGLSLFAGILIALAISLILGAFAEDVKSVAGLTTPIMILVLIPYFLTLFMDINSLPPTLRNITLAIPFSHVFLAAPNLFLHHYAAVVWGIFYQLLWFAAAVIVAAKIFSTDKIVTMKLNFSKKRR